MRSPLSFLVFATSFIVAGMLLVKYPAVLWAAGGDYPELKEHCKRAAQAYLQEQKDAGNPLMGPALSRSRDVVEGSGPGD